MALFFPRFSRFGQLGTEVHYNVSVHRFAMNDEFLMAILALDTSVAHQVCLNSVTCSILIIMCIM